MDFQTTKILGGIGAILMFITPFIGVYTSILGLVGLILVLIAMKGLADNYSEQGIFNNALYGLIAFIVGGVIAAAVIVWGTVGLLTRLGIDLANWQMIQQIDWSALTDFSIFSEFIVGVLAGLVTLFVFVVFASIFLRKSLNLLAAKSRVGLFGTTGLLILIGAILTIVILGLLLIWISLLLLAVSFFSLRPTTPEPATPPPQPA